MVLDSLNNFRIRRDGAIVRVEAGSLRHDFDFGEGPNAALVNALGDVVTAYRSTGIANIETYSQPSRPVELLTWAARRLGGLLTMRLPRCLLDAVIQQGPAGPGERERRTSHATFVAEIEGADGERVTARLCVAGPYGFAAAAVVAIAVRVPQGAVRLGYQAPSLAYGADFVRQFNGVEWDRPDG